MVWSYSKAESVSKSVDNSGSSVLGTAVTGSISAAGASTDGDSLFAGDILCFPRKQKRKEAEVEGDCMIGKSYGDIGKVCIRAKWPIRPELIAVSVA